MSAGARILLPHEIHSGIIPKFEWVTDAHRWAWKGVKETNQQDEFHKAGKIGFMQRLTNFQFYLHRWGARSMSLSGVFNPNVVLGLPALVMDRAMPAPAVQRQIEEAIGRRWMPVQYLGKIAHVAHNLNQGGGQTQVGFTHCRTHRGLDDEFLGVLVKEVEETKEKRFTVKFSVPDLIDSVEIERSIEEEEEQELQSLPGRRVIKNRGDYITMVKLHTEGSLVDGQRVPRQISAFRGAVIKKIKFSGSVELDEASASIFSLKPNESVTIEYDKIVAGPDAPATSPDAATEAVPTYTTVTVQEGAEIIRVPEKFEITMSRQVGTGTFRRTKRSVEEAMTPGWYSDIWSNAKITESVYAPLLGTESINADTSKTSRAGALAIVDQLALAADKQDEIIDRSFETDIATQTFEVSEGFGSSETTTPSTSLDNVTKMEVIPGSIEEAVDSLAIIYSLLRTRGADIHDFIKQYTKRPIANLEQILGSHNLAFADNGEIDPNIQDDVMEGFHSRAFGDYNTDVKLPDREGAKPEPGKDALKALFPGQSNPASVTRKNIFNRGNPPSSILPELDPRGRARARVRLYLQELTVSRGLLG